MQIDQLSMDTMKTLLKYLIDSGELSKETVSRAMKGAVPTEMKRMTDIIHQLLCQADHEREEGLNTCRYYQEEMMEDGWVQKDHEYWLNVTNEIMEELALTNEDQLRKALTLAKVMQTKLRELQVNEPKAYRLLLKINGWEWT